MEILRHTNHFNATRVGHVRQHPPNGDSPRRCEFRRGGIARARVSRIIFRSSSRIGFTYISHPLPAEKERVPFITHRYHSSVPGTVYPREFAFSNSATAILIRRRRSPAGNLTYSNLISFELHAGRACDCQARNRALLSAREAAITFYIEDKDTETGERRCGIFK